MTTTTTHLPVGVTTIQVDGMTCGHCERAITAELTALTGVDSVEVDLSAGAVTLHASAPVAVAAVTAAVDEAGYTLTR